MQTFLPLDDFAESAKVLDYRRLGKQRVEAMQIINTIISRLTHSGKIRMGWVNHPAVRMWRGYIPALQLYHNVVITEWIRRGYNNNMQLEIIEDEVVMPPWMENPNFHASHRSNLLRKDPGYYSQFGWTEPNNLEYMWPA